jgi:phosphoribosyl-ATP pyrophosphohydrolase
MMPDTITRLTETIKSRRDADATTSYVAQLLTKGPEKAAKKLGEETTELAMASAQGAREKIVYEAADVLFHLLVLLEAHRIPLEEVTAELARREGTSGIAEKASRT